MVRRTAERARKYLFPDSSFRIIQDISKASEDISFEWQQKLVSDGAREDTQASQGRDANPWWVPFTVCACREQSRYQRGNMFFGRVGGLLDGNKERLDSSRFNAWVRKIKRLQEERKDIA